MCLLKLGLLSLGLGLVLQVKLLVLCNLLLELRKGGLKLRLIEDLSLLVGIDLASSYEFFETLARVLGEDIINFGSVCLE